MTNEIHYDYPPSAHIKALGEIIPETHFIADGILTLASEDELECYFEVAYTRDSKVIGVIYLTSHALGSAGSVAPQLVSLKGVDRQVGYTVQVTGLAHSGWTEEFYSGKQRIPFTATRFDAKTQEASDDLLHIFALINFPIPHEFNGVGNYMELVTEQGLIAKLYHLRGRKEREYPTQPMTALIIDPQDVPQGWQIENAAEMICNLLSVASGLDVQWLEWQYGVNVASWPMIAGKGYLSRRTQPSRFYSFIIDYYLTTSSEIEPIKLYMSACLSWLFQHPFEEVDIYRRLLALYKEYANVNSMSHATSGRLLTTLAEELVEAWEQSENIREKTKLVSETEKDRLIDVIKGLITQNTAKLLDEAPNQSIEMRIAEIQQRLEDIISTNINTPSFVKRIERLFDRAEGKLDIRFKNNLPIYIQSFVTSRNSLAHSGCLATDSPDKRVRKKIQKIWVDDTANNEYANIVHMLPLMFAAIFGYTGSYRAAEVIVVRSKKPTTPSVNLD
jgi:hypothetical protein